MSRTGSTLLGFALLLGACGSSDGDGATANPSGGGKADGIGDDTLCPAEVALNAGQGSSKRCYDADSGQFVPTACCEDLCAGASMREQSNGERCAWTGEPGLPGASTGQFAPQLCCDLNGELACGRAVLEGGACVDPESGVGVDAACCTDEPTSCHPSVAGAIGSCIYAQVESFRDEGLPLPNTTALFDQCTQEFDGLAGRLDERCAFQPELPFCGLDFESVVSDFIEPCVAQERDTFDCSLGTTFFDTAAQSHITTVHRAEHTLASAMSLGATQQEQIAAAASSVYGETLSLDGAFDVADEGRINLVEFYDLSNNASYTAVEFGAGDNSVGAFFRAGTLERIADIGDGDIYGCDAPLGAGGNTCSENADCADGFRCEGTTDADNPISTPLGLCVDTSVPASYDSCEDIRDCDTGTYCAGIIGFGGSGMCSPGWMFGERTNEALLQVDGTSERSDVLIYGQASVPMDLELTLDLFHDVDTSALTVELLIPGYEGGTDDDRPRVTVWPAEGVSTSHPTGGRVTVPVRAFGDESINGEWTVVVTDDGLDGSSGGVFGWTLAYSSRYD